MVDARFEPGDWYCKGCGDLQFARNTQCRLCKAPKPEGAGGGGDGIGGPSNLVQQIAKIVKAGQRQCVPWKDRYTEFIQNEGSINKDPLRHSVATLRRFMQEALPDFEEETWIWEFEKPILEIVGYDLNAKTFVDPIFDEDEQEEVYSDPLPEEEIAEFINSNNLDPKAAESFRDLKPIHQRQVINRGDLSETRNPSAVVLSRIRAVLRGEDGQKGMGKGGKSNDYPSKGGKGKDSWGAPPSKGGKKGKGSGKDWYAESWYGGKDQWGGKGDWGYGGGKAKGGKGKGRPSPY